MGSDRETLNYNLSEITKKISKTYDLSKTEVGYLADFREDIPGQVVYTESGNNIVVKAYGTQEVNYRKVTTEYNDLGNGKCEKVVTVWQARFNPDSGTVIWDGDLDFVSSKTTIVKSAASEPDYVYQMVNSKGKLIKTISYNEFKHGNRIVVDPSKVLVNLIFKNGTPDGAVVDLFTDEISHSITLNETVFQAVKSGKTYKGNWLKEEASSSINNETFALGTNEDTIKYDMSGDGKHGKDTVKLASGADLTIDLQNDDGVVNSYEKKGNDIIMSMKKDNFSGSEYTKYEYIITKNSSGTYDVIWNQYDWSDLSESYELNTDESSNFTWTKAEFLEVQKSLLQYEGLHIHEGTTTYYTDGDGNFYDADTVLGQVTFKNYLKLAEDGVKIGDTSLKYILENTEGVGILNYFDTDAKQKIQGTFLSEKISGSQGNDTITTGGGSDNITVSGGKDSITINKNGSLYIESGSSENFRLGETTIKYGKGLTYATAEEIADGNYEGKTALNVAGLTTNPNTNAGLCFVKSGNDMVLDYEAMQKIENMFGGNNEIQNSRVIIKDFFKNEDIQNSTIFGYNGDHEGITFDDYMTETGGQLFQIGEQKKANKLEDTKYMDYIAGGEKADKITINYGDAMVLAGKGNDTINVGADANGVVNLMQVKGSGNDVLNIAQGSEAGVIVDGEYSRPSIIATTDLSFERTYNDLIFNIQYADDVTDTLTIKNYFASNPDVDFAYGDDLMGNYIDALQYMDKKLKINGVKNGGYNQYYLGTNYSDEYNYEGKGIAYMYDQGTSFKDTYNLNITNKSSLIIDDRGGQDNVVFSGNANTNLRIFVDVDTAHSSNNNLFIFDKSCINSKNVKEALNIKNIMPNNLIKLNGGVVIKDGIERLTGTYSYSDSTGNINMNSWITGIKNQVVSWLNTHEEFNSVTDVFNSKNTGAINELIAIYSQSYSDATAYAP